MSQLHLPLPAKHRLLRRPALQPASVSLAWLATVLMLPLLRQKVKRLLKAMLRPPQLPKVLLRPLRLPKVLLQLPKVLPQPLMLRRQNDLLPSGNSSQ